MSTRAPRQSMGMLTIGFSGAILLITSRAVSAWGGRPRVGASDLPSTCAKRALLPWVLMGAIGRGGAARVADWVLPALWVATVWMRFSPGTAETWVTKSPFGPTTTG